MQIADATYKIRDENPRNSGQEYYSLSWFGLHVAWSIGTYDSVEPSASHHQDRRDRPIILKMEAACYSETLALTSGYKTKRRYIPEENRLYSVDNLAQNICNWANFL